MQALASLTPTQVAEIRQLPHFANSIYNDLNLDGTLDYMRRRFVEPIRLRIRIEEATLADCASGYGWLSFAYLLCGGGAAILVEPDRSRLDAARQIGNILGVADRCSFVCSLLQELNIGEDAVDVFCCVETLEHVGRSNVPACVAAMAYTARSMVLLTTPNQLFPKVQHDTFLPLAHWMPARLRRQYARAFGRTQIDFGSYFLRPWDLAPLEGKYHPDSTVQTFRSVEEYRNFYPHYMPYGAVDAIRWRAHPPRFLPEFHSMTAALLGSRAFMVAPNLASVWARSE